MNARAKLMACREAVALRRAAIEFAAHLHDEPADDADTAGRKRWARLAATAYEYARATGKLPWVTAK